MRIIANHTPDWDKTEVYLDGSKVENAFEADDVENKVWVDSDNALGYEVLKGKVEFKKKPPQININQQSEMRGGVGFYGSIPNVAKCTDLNCPWAYISHVHNVDGTINCVASIDKTQSITYARKEIEGHWTDEVPYDEHPEKQAAEEYISALEASMINPREITVNITADTSKLDEAIETLLKAYKELNG